MGPKRELTNKGNKSGILVDSSRSVSKSPTRARSSSLYRDEFTGRTLSVDVQPLNSVGQRVALRRSRTKTSSPDARKSLEQVANGELSTPNSTTFGAHTLSSKTGKKTDKRRCGSVPRHTATIPPNLSRPNNLTSQPVTINLAYIFGACRSVLGSLVVSLAILVTVVWAFSPWLDKACDQAAIRTTSGALSWIVQVDVCNVVMEDRVRPRQTLSGLEVIQSGQSLGQAIGDLVDSTSDVALYSKVAQQVYETAGHMALDLQSRISFSQSEALGHLAESLHEELEDFFTMYTDFEIEMKTAVSTAIADFRKLGIRFDNLVIDADNLSNWDRILDTWAQSSVLGKWYHPPSPKSALTATLVKSTSTLVPKLEDLYRTSDNLASILESVVIELDGIKIRLRDEETVNQGKSLAQFVETVDQQLWKVTNLFTQVTTAGDRFGEVRKNVLHLRRTTEQSGSLVFSRSDSELAHRAVAKLLKSFEEIDRKWQSMLLESGPPSGTVKRVGVM